MQEHKSEVAKPQVSLRAVREDEFEEVADLAMKAYLGLPGYCLNEGYITQIRDTAGRYAAPNAQVLVAVDENDTILGTATFISGPGAFSENNHEDYAGMRVLAVSDKARGRGIGKMLVEECVRRATEDKLRKKLLVMTCDWMTAAVQLYLKAGFRRVPHLDKVVTPQLIAIGFEIDLPS